MNCDSFVLSAPIRKRENYSVEDAFFHRQFENTRTSEREMHQWQKMADCTNIHELDQFPQTYVGSCILPNHNLLFQLSMKCSNK